MNSSPAEVISAPEPALEPEGLPAEQPSASGLPSGGWRPWLIAVVVVVVSGVLLFFIVRSTPSAPARSTQVPIQGNPGKSLRLKGTTEAVQSRAILAPVLEGQQISTLTITKLTSAGTRVKRGDLLVEFDRQAQMRDALDKQAEYDKLAAQVVGEQSKEAAAKAKDETELKQAEDNLRKAELEMQKAEIVSRK